MSRNTSSNIADTKMEKSVGASTQPCLTPSVTVTNSETCPPIITFAIIAVCRASTIVVTLSGRPYFPRTCPSPVVQLRPTHYRSRQTSRDSRSSSMPFSNRCRTQTIISTALRLPMKPHCVSGTTSGVMWVDSLLMRILAKILPAIERRYIPL